MATVLERGPVQATDGEAASIRELDEALAAPTFAPALVIAPDGKQLRLPAAVRRLLVQAVHELARGRAVTVVPVNTELTTQQAADVLNVSRPFVVKLLESGEIPFYRVGRHRRIRLDDVTAYRRRRSRARRDALAEMARDAQELGIYE